MSGYPRMGASIRNANVRSSNGEYIGRRQVRLVIRPPCRSWQLLAKQCNAGEVSRETEVADRKITCHIGGKPGGKLRSGCLRLIVDCAPESCRPAPYGRRRRTVAGAVRSQALTGHRPHLVKGSSVRSCRANASRTPWPIYVQAPAVQPKGRRRPLDRRAPGGADGRPKTSTLKVQGTSLSQEPPVQGTYLH